MYFYIMFVIYIIYLDMWVNIDLKTILCQFDLNQRFHAWISFHGLGACSRSCAPTTK